MNDYINSLKSQNKLNISIDKSIDFEWDYYKIAGPCSVEGPGIIDIANDLKKVGIDALRAGAYKPCTFPILEEKNGWKEGLRREGLDLLMQTKLETGIPIVTEVMDPRMIETVGEVADVFLMMIPALKELTNIPVIYDPSHSTGYRNFVKPISSAALAAGADGLIVECHPDPDKSISDPAQAINYDALEEIFKGW